MFIFLKISLCIFTYLILGMCVAALMIHKHIMCEPSDKNELFFIWLTAIMWPIWLIGIIFIYCPYTFFKTLTDDVDVPDENNSNII